MVQCGEEYLIRSTVEIGTGPDDDDSDELLRKHIRQHFESLRPKILVSVPDAVLAADPDLAAHLDKVSNVIVEIFKGLRYSIRSRIWAERVATRRQEKWDRMRAAASVVKKRKGPKRISSDDLAGIATIGQFFAPANLKNASQSDPNKLDDE
ncbi:uncharacterized protein JCM15063_001645, partial [Sporobolomyces koalae]|uniref:uncharacterized protein n=1 Tax=Sporobolomyces koalae TaxID=500713 RepID=UPI00317F12FF